MHLVRYSSRSRIVFVSCRLVFHVAGDANPLVAESEIDFDAKWPFKVIQGHLLQYP